MKWRRIRLTASPLTDQSSLLSCVHNHPALVPHLSASQISSAKCGWRRRGRSSRREWRARGWGSRRLLRLSDTSSALLPASALCALSRTAPSSRLRASSRFRAPSTPLELPRPPASSLEHVTALQSSLELPRALYSSDLGFLGRLREPAGARFFCWACCACIATSVSSGTSYTTHRRMLSSPATCGKPSHISSAQPQR